MKEKSKNPWTVEDEKGHFLSVKEWWCGELFFKSIEDNKKWSLKTGFTRWFVTSKKLFSIFEMTLFDLDNNLHFPYFSWTKSAKLEQNKENLIVNYEDSYLKGSFPKYQMHLKNPKNDTELDIDYNAKSLPHWVAQDVTGGWLPMGLGFYRYGFIPKNDISGTMKIKDKTYNIEGQGYFEHVWGDFSNRNPLTNVGGLKKTMRTYTKLAGWWLHNHKIRIPKSIIFSSENNPFGYDWAWALLDNGWTVFYGNILFWIMKGPAAGVLILSKDGETYEEFCNINFKYNETRHAKNFDFFYPSELELTVKKGKKELHLCFTMTTECEELVSKFAKGRYWVSYIICEAPGKVEGYYFDGEKEIKLNGICKIEPQRQISKLGHNSLELEFLLPPKGIGVSFNLDSHFFRKKILTNIQLAPRPKINFSFDRIDASKIHK
jgi:hypothetical protein